MFQPLAGYVLDVVGLRIGFAIFAIAWSLISMAHGLASSWQAFAGLRGLLGLAEGSANPAGMKATSEWFPAQGARTGRRVSTTSARRSDRCSRRRWSRGRSSPTTGRSRSSSPAPRPGVGRAVAAASISRRDGTRGSRRRAQLHHRGPGEASARRRPRPSIGRILRAAQLLGDRAAAVPGRSDVGHADLLAAALPEHGPALRSEADRAVRAGCRFWPPISAACSAGRSASRCRSTPASA